MVSGISLVAVDLDGTLLTSQGTLAPKSAHLLRRASREGVCVVLATTRNPDSVRPFCRALEIADPIVCTNGAQVWGSPDGPVWACHTIPRAVALSMAQTADVHHWELSTTVGSTTYWRQQPGQPLGPTAPHITVVPSNVNGVVGDPVRILVSQPEAIEGIRSLCQARFADRCHTEIYYEADGSTHSLGVFAHGASKGAGLALVLERLRVEREAVMAIGDNLSDLSMFPCARIRVLMANAPQSVKRRASAMAAVIAPSNDDEGVAWALSTLAFEWR